MCDILGIKLDFASAGKIIPRPPPARTLSASDCTKLCSLISAYRLLEIAAFGGGKTVRAPVRSRAAFPCVDKPLYVGYISFPTRISNFVLRRAMNALLIGQSSPSNFGKWFKGRSIGVEWWKRTGILVHPFESFACYLATVQLTLMTRLKATSCTRQCTLLV